MPGVPIIGCTAISLPEPPPGFRVPHFGLMQKAREGLYTIPSPSTYLIKMQDVMAPALAPIKMYLEMLDAALALWSCIKSTIDAITQLSPNPLLDCLKNLQKAIKVLTSYIPPLSWIQTALDLAKYAYNMLDEIVDLFRTLDARITYLTKGWDYALGRGNTDLQSITACGLSDIKALMVNVQPIILFIIPGQQILLDVMDKYTGEPRIKLALQKHKAMQVWFPLAFAAMQLGESLPAPPLGLPTPDPPAAPHSMVPVPPLGAMFASLVEIQNTAADIYNTLGPFLGRSDQLAKKEVPNFTNF